MSLPVCINRYNLDPLLTPARFEPLAVYNAERARGLLHSAGWMAEMARLQMEFNEWKNGQEET